MNVPRDRMINQILDFVDRHPESTASLAVRNRILTRELRHQADNPMDPLRDRINDVPDSTLESLYFIVK